MTLRYLTEGEKNLARSIFGNQINYDVVQISDSPAAGQKVDTLYTPNNKIYYGEGTSYLYSSDISTMDSWDAKATFIHEITHVWQFQQMGGLFGRLILFQMDQGSFFDPHGNYDYDDVFRGVPFHLLRLEAQAEFLQDYFLLKNGQNINDKGPYGEHLENANRTLSDFEAVINAQVGGLKPVDVTDPNFISPDRYSNGGYTKVSDSFDLSDLLRHIQTLWNRAEERCPLVLDLDGTGGVELTHVRDNPVYWDTNNDGFKEATAWVTGGDGLLTIDLNANGLIDNHSELFGNDSIGGFASLAAYDSNADSNITSADAQFGDLRVWVDANQDGMSQVSELKTLFQLNISQINLGSTNINVAINGNTVTQTSTFTINGNSQTIANVNLKTDTMNTVYDEDYTIDSQAFFLPTLRGYGTVADLHIAMSIDNSGVGNLRDKVLAFSEQSFADLFQSNAAIIDDAKAILYRWAGVENVVAGSRGAHVDAKELAFMEKTMGNSYLQNGGYTNPFNTASGNEVSRGFELALKHFYARLLGQTAAKEIFTGELQYDLFSDKFSGVSGLNQAMLESLETEATALSSTALRSAFWQNVVRFIEYSIGVEQLDGVAQAALNAAIHDSDATLTLSGISDLAKGTYVISGSPYGTDNDEILVGDRGNDLIYGYGGSDILKGLDGDDQLNDFGSGDGDDVLVGGRGNDKLFGGSGNDTYHYEIGEGNDTVYESGGDTNDRIIFGAGIDLSNLSFYRIGAYDVKIIIGNGVTAGELYLKDQLFNGYNVDKIQFADGTFVNLTDIVVNQTGTSGNDSINGIRYGASVNDVMHGGDGNDTLYGGSSGNDRLYGEAGNDTLNGNDQSDYLDGGTGDDMLRGYSGNDYYVYNGGLDNFYEQSAGYDTVEIANGWNLSDITFVKPSGTSHLQIQMDLLNTLTLRDQLYSSGAYSFEVLTFADGFSLDLTEFNQWIFSGTTVFYGDNNNTSGVDLNDIIIGGSITNEIRGYEGNDVIYGGSGNDSLFGNDGNDILNGGTGNDAMEGGAGDDLYFIDDALDTVIEAGSSGTDSVRSSVSLTLSANVENIALIGNTNINGTGNSLDNTISGNDGNNTLSGAGGNDILIGGGGVDTFVGGTGNDVFVLSGLSDTINENAGEGIDTVQSGLTYSIASLVNVENLTLMGAANINGTGNSAGNIIIGNTGNNILDGGSGTDTLIGGIGDDIYVVNTSADIITENAGEGTDTIQSTVTLTLNTTPLANIENLTLLGTGNINATGNALNNILIGNTGNNTLNGFTGADTCYGGLGNDVYVFDNSADVAIENAGEGTDTIQTYTNYTLSANIENLTLLASGYISGTGNSVDNVITGNAGNNNLHGMDGHDTINGMGGNDTLNGNEGNDILDGGIGADTINGGTGDDTAIYIRADNASVTETYNGNEGRDSLKLYLTTAEMSPAIQADIVAYRNFLAVAGNTDFNAATGGSFTFTSLNLTVSRFEELHVFVDGTEQNITGTSGADTLHGDAGNNLIYGLDANDTLYGHEGNDTLDGGTGSDTMIGGLGDDIYVFNTASDIATENASEGTDTIQANASIHMLNSSINHVENLTALGTANFSLTGNSLNNVITGNSGNNILNGYTGADTMIGGLGNDSYYTDTSGDTVIENAGEGTDTWFTYVNNTLSANVENLTILGTVGISGTGNELDNLITGNTGNNNIKGMDGNDTLDGGAGLDTLTGGADADTFVFKAASAFSNIDVIADFSTGDADKINIADLLIGYSSGTSNINDFVSLTTSGGNTSFLVDRDGAASTYNDQSIATLNGVTGLNLNELFNNGHIVAA